ncbi:NERD domain-containing protein [Metasolibacillus sp.]|uniref:NERD domain-containing protein n=1 Tax=Metasolibacillus sp. TaxID=2703680 RepID=UPI0025D86D36|nr:NERD domain-containing protein [Metasolibacillus sp.]MCT6926257.1 NERD domain-containing protein [Metasolibacillus sp.]MCT6942494.1 NERD domain-containing protein [Metasolibacillus sp.]
MKYKQLEAIMRRVDSQCPDYHYFVEQHALAAAGIAGENEVFYFLQELAMPHQILRNFCLIDFAAHRHEMDFLIIFSSFILCLEVKNIAGQLNFDVEASQLLRTRADGVIERFPNPVAQLTRHIRFLSSLFPHIPIVGSVVIANRRVIIGSRRNTHIPIFHADYLHSFIESSLKQYTKPVLQINTFYEQLLTMQAPTIKPFSFTLADFKKGVFCEKCSYKMHFIQGRFICSNCHHQDKFAHFQALADFRLLVDSKITNQEFRTLCEISSRYAAKRLLKYLPIIKQGRTTYYEIPEQIVTIAPHSPN